MNKVICCIIAGIFMLSCTSQITTVRYIVASQTADCTGVAPQQCLLVKKAGATDWEYFYAPIEGFNYEEGYEYEIEVKEENVENPPADASSIKYTLVNQLSKTAKTSENLPEKKQANKQIQWVGKVIEIEEVNLGRGAAEGKFPAKVVKVEVTSTTSDKFKAGDIIHCELIAEPIVTPEVGREYVFKAKDFHPAHAKGIYLLETNVQDLV